MKKTFLLMIAMLLAISGWTQTTLNQGFEGATFPPEDWTTLSSSTATRWARNTSSPVIGTASAQYAFVTGGQRTYLITPKLSVSTNDTLKFYAAKSSTGTTHFRVCISTSYENDGDMSSFDTINPLFYSLAANLPSALTTQYKIDLSAYAGREVYIAFQTTDYNGCNIFLDSITGPTLFIPTCPKTSVLNYSNITSSSIDLSWTETGFANQWLIEYKPSTETSWDNALSVNATSTAISLTNLVANNFYDVRIKAICDANDESDWRLGCFRTLCENITAFPFVENFNNSVIIEPTCWTRMSGLLSSTSTLTTSSSGWDYTTNLNSVMKVNVFGTSVNYWLISPSLDLGDGSIQYQVDLDVNLSAFNNPNNVPASCTDDKFAVVVSTDNGLTWSNANATIWYDGDQDQTRNYSSFGLTTTHLTVKLLDSSLQPYTGICKIGFYGESSVTNGDNDLYIDNFAINEIPNCPDVFNVIVNAATFTSAQVNFATDNAEQGTYWEMVYGEATDANNFNPDALTPIIINSPNELPYLISGLTPGSNIYVAVRQSCGGAWSQYENATIPAIQPTESIPYTQNFNDLTNISEWTLSGNDTNKWVINSIVNNPISETELTGNSLFISNDNGLSNSYTTNSIAYAYASTIIDFGNTGAAEYNLSFDWKGKGESSNFDYIKVYLLPIGSTIPTTGWPAGLALCENLNMQINWQHKSIVLPRLEYENTIKKLVFVWWNDGSGGTNPPAAVDNISIQAMTCATPSNLVIETTDQTTATLSWIENGTANQWLVEYSTDDINWTPIVANTNTNFTINGLSPSSYYHVKVSAQCNPSDLSTKISNNFKTECGVISQFPWTEGFENAFVPAVAPSNTSSPYCWINFNGGVSSTYSWNRGTSSSNIHSGNAYAYMDGYASATDNTYNNNDWLITPTLNLNGNERLNFWVKKEGASYLPDLAIYALNVANGDMTAIDSISNFNIVANIPANEITTTYQEKEINLSSLIGQYRLAFVRLQPSQYDLYIDDVKVSTLPSCAKPTSVISSNITINNAEISWVSGHSTDAAWWLYYKDESTTEYDSIPIITNPYQLQNLTPNTIYNVYLKTDCGTQLSETSDIISLRTACDAISTLPWNENFDSYGTASETFLYCWARPVIYNTYPSIVTSNHSAPASMKFQSETTHPTYVITPQFNYELNALKVSFWLKAEGLAANQSGAIQVGVMSNNSDTTTFELVQTIQPTSTDWTFYEIPLSEISLSGLNNYIAFKHNSQASNWYYWLDDVNVDLRPICPNTYSLGVTSATENGVTLNWSTLNSAGQGWEISYGEIATGFDPSVGNIVSVANDPLNPPYTINELNPETTYSFAVRQACGGEWSNIVTTNTMGSPATIPYTCDFENELERNAWLLLNGTAENKWFIGSSVNSTPITGNSLYISKNNNGDSNIYNMSSTSTVSASRLIEFDGSSAYSLTFNSRVGGESSFDYLKVYLVNSDTSFTGDASTPYYGENDYSNGVVLYNETNPYFNNINNPTIVNNHTIELPYQGEAGTIKKLIFVWRNDNGAGVQPPACIDNIAISPLSCSTPNVPTVSNITSSSVDIAWTDPNANNTAWNVYYRPANLGGDYSVLTNVSNPTTITNLVDATNYEVYVTTNCGTEESQPTYSILFSTHQIPAQIPYICDFEDVTQNSSWVLKNGTCLNKWKIGTPTSTTNNSIFISKNDTTASYDLLTANITIAEREIEFNDSDSIKLSFDLSVGGESTYDYLKVYLVNLDTIFSPISGTAYYGEKDYAQGVIIKDGTKNYMNLLSGTITFDTTFINPGQGTIKKLVFVWKNDGSSGDGVSPIIDNISIIPISTCSTPTAVTVNNITNTTADVAWTAGGSETSWQVRLGTAGTPIDANTPSYQLTNLTAATNYTVYVRANCGTSYSAWVASTQFTTQNSVVTPPTVATATANPIAQTTATLNGTVTAGTENISAQGFEYKLASASSWTNVAATGVNMTYNLTGLAANTAYEFKAFATTATNTYYGNIINFTTTNVAVTAPTVVTDSVSAITHNQANLYGTITTGTENISAQGFAYKLASASTWTNVSAIGATITYNLTGLAANTAYEFKAFATTATNTYYGNVETFTTLTTPVVLGSVSTQAVTNLVDHSALLNGTLVSVGNAVENIEVGFVYSTENNPEIGGTDVIIAQVNYVDGMTTYDKSINGLLSETNYYYKAYVTNSAGTAYGQEQPFLTSSLNDAEKNQFTVSMYPNPTTSTTKLVVSGIEGEAKIVISDVQGRILNTTIAKAVNGKVEQTIDVNNFAKGIYYVRIQNTTTSRTQKLIVQ